MNSQMENYEPMLTESIKHFLTVYRSGSSDFSTFESIFFRKIQTMLDPPLEVIWFYAAVTLHSAKLTQTNQFGKVLLLTKDLLRLLTGCSRLSNGSKKITLLAPVIYEVYNVVTDSLAKGLCLRKDVDDLLQEITSYIVLCCCNESESNYECGQSLVCLDDLVRVWTIDRVGPAVVGGVSNFRENLRVFFPVLSDAFLDGIFESRGIQNFAGIVLFEVFMLRLCLKFNTGIVKEDMQEGLQRLAVQTIEGFKNCCFLDVLLRMLLEPALSVNGLLSSDDAVFLRKILYDAVILVDYSFLRSDRWLQLHNSHLNNLALIWALVADAAQQFAREISDQGRTVSYANAFDNSHLLNQLIGWISSRVGVEEKFRRSIRTPRALINWLYFLQDQGLGVFDHSISALLNKVVIAGSRSEFQFSNHGKDAHNLTGSVKECLVNMDQEMFESPPNNACPSGMWLCSEGTRKRKEGMMMFEASETRAKLVKCDLSEKVVCNERFGGGN